MGNGSTCGSGALHIHPLAALRGFQHGVADILRAQRVTEIRVGLRRGGIVERLEELRELVDERVLVAEAETRDPPVAGVWLITIGAMDTAPAATVTWHAVVEIREAVEVVEIPEEGLVLTVDLEGVERLMTTGIAGGFEDRERAVFETS